LETLNNQKLEYYICGDINNDLLKYETKTTVKNYTDKLLSIGCVPVIK